MNGESNINAECKASRVYSDTDNLNVQSLSLGCNLGSSEGDVSKELASVQALIDSKADINALDENGTSALSRAVVVPELSPVVAALLTAGADVNVSAAHGRNPGHEAIKHNSMKSLELIVAADTSRAAELLTYACLHENAEAVKLVAAHTADVNARDSKGLIPLHCAARTGNLGVLESLLAAGADANIVADDGEPALCVAAKHGHAPALSALIAAGADVDLGNRAGESALFAAIQLEKEELVAALIAAGADVNKPNEDDVSPLMQAVLQKHLPLTNMLLAAKADPDHRRGRRGAMCVLEEAVESYWAPGIYALIDAGANLDVVSPPLMNHAIQNGDLAFVEKLVAAGVDVNISKRSIPPLHAASQQGHVDIVKFLLTEKAAINAASRGDMAPLHFAACTGSAETVRVLLAAGADPNQYAEEENMSALYIASSGQGSNGLLVIRALLDAGADVNKGMGNYACPLWSVARDGNLDAVNIFINAGADLNYGNPEETALFAAAKDGHELVVRALVDAKADVNCESEDMSVLFAAAENDHTGIVRTLLAAGADVRFRKHGGATLVHAAAGPRDETSAHDDRPDDRPAHDESELLEVIIEAFLKRLAQK